MKKIRVTVTLPLIVRERFAHGSLQIDGVYTFQQGLESKEEFEFTKVTYNGKDVTRLFEYLNEEWYFPFIERMINTGVEEGRRLLNSGEDDSDAWKQAELFPEE